MAWTFAGLPTAHAAMSMHPHGFEGAICADYWHVAKSGAIADLTAWAVDWTVVKGYWQVEVPARVSGWSCHRCSGTEAQW